MFKLMAKIYDIRTQKLIHDDDADQFDDAYYKNIENKVGVFFEGATETCLCLAEEDVNYGFDEMILIIPDRTMDSTVAIRPTEMSTARYKKLIAQAFEKSKLS